MPEKHENMDMKFDFMVFQQKGFPCVLFHLFCVGLCTEIILKAKTETEMAL